MKQLSPWFSGVRGPGQREQAAVALQSGAPVPPGEAAAADGQAGLGPALRPGL